MEGGDKKKVQGGRVIPERGTGGEKKITFVEEKFIFHANFWGGHKKSIENH